MTDSTLKKRRRPEDETPQPKKKKVEFEEKPAIASSFSVTKLLKPQVSPPVVGEADAARRVRGNGADWGRSTDARNFAARLIPIRCLREDRAAGSQAAKERRLAAALRDGAALLRPQVDRLHGAGRAPEERGHVA